MSSEETTSGWASNDPSFASRAIHHGSDPGQWKHRMLTPPIVTSSTFQQLSPGKTVDNVSYGRFANPTRKALEDCLAEIDNAKYALAVPSGMAGVALVTYMLKAGDNIVCIGEAYAGTLLDFTRIINNYNITTTFADFTKPEEVRRAIKPNTKLLWFETPTNPLLNVIDVREICSIVQQINPKVIKVLDNTFLTAYFQRTLNMGVDIVHYSLTKFANGHHDVIMGALVTNNEEYYKQLKFLQGSLGIIPSAFDCFLMHRSLRTLHIRMERHFSNALKLAQYLEQHPNVLKVIHPGLRSHPHHELAKKQTCGHSGIMSMFVRGDYEQSVKFTTSLKIATLADSLGGVGTTVCLPVIATRGYVDPSVCDRSAITENLIRVSVGLENIDDLIQDFKKALDVTYKDFNSRL